MRHIFPLNQLALALFTPVNGSHSATITKAASGTELTSEQ